MNPHSTLPILQDDAFLITVTHGHYSIFFFFCIFSSITSPPLFPLVFRFREGPDWLCVGDAQSIVSSSPAVPVTSVSILFFTREPTDQKCGRLSRRACPPRNTAIQGRQHRQPSQLIPQSIFSTRRVSGKFSASRCIRDRERVDVIDAYRCDLTNRDVRAIFEKYGKGGIWGVVHIAVRFHVAL